MGAYLRLSPSHSSNLRGITEIVLPATSEHQYAYVLPMLAHLSRQTEDRWFTWIAPRTWTTPPVWATPPVWIAPRGINRKLLIDFGFALDRVRIIHTHDDDETRRVLWDALAMGNSATVVVSHESLSTQDINKLEEAAHIGDAQGLLLRHRRADWN